MRLVTFFIAVLVMTGPAWALTPNPDGHPTGYEILTWHLDDPTGTSWTDSAWSNTMKGTGAATSVQGLFYGAAGGFADTGIKSPGYDSPKGHEFTVEAWIMWPTGTNPQADQQLLFERRSTQMLWYVCINNLGTQQSGQTDRVLFAAWTTPTATAVLSEPCNFVNNQWYHIAVTCQHIDTDNNTIKIYVTPVDNPGQPILNPICKATATGVLDMPASTNANVGLSVGGGVSSGLAGRNFDGIIDEVRMSSACLTSFDSYALGMYPRVSTVAWGATQQFYYDSTYLPLDWQVYDVFPSGVGSITSNGLFTALKPGACQVVVTDSASNMDYLDITVPYPEVSPNAVTLQPGATQQFSYNTLAPPVTWQVINESSPDIGTIDATGLFTARHPGTCQIQATDNDGNVDTTDFITVSTPVVSPDSAVVSPTGNQQFTFSSMAIPITWEIVNDSTAGIGTIDSTGLFTASGLIGTCNIRATDAFGNTDDSDIVTVAIPVIAPQTANVVKWNTVQFTCTPSVAGATWSVTDESGPAGSVGTINPSTGLFTALGPGTCTVTCEYSPGKTITSGTINVITPSQYNYCADANTLVLYHFDEAVGNSWLDSSGNNLTANVNNVSYPVSHVLGWSGNAVGEFQYQTANNRWIQTPGSNPNLFGGAATTIECWVMFPTGIDIMTATAPPPPPAINIRGILSMRIGGNKWVLCAGAYSYNAATQQPNGVAGGVCFVYWAQTGSTNFFGWSPNAVFTQNDVWYHVAVTYQPIGGTPPQYEVKIYVTPQGTTTPQLVFETTTPIEMQRGGTGLYIGTESTNSRKFCGYIDEVRISNKVRSLQELSWSLAGVPSVPLSIGEAKKNAADDAVVSLTGAISANLSGCSYLEDVNRSAGIRLDTKQKTLGLAAGDLSTITGYMATANNERILKPLHAEKTAVLTPALAPLGMANKSAGGGMFGLTSGATGASGLNNFGQLVRVWGKYVTSGTDSRGAYFVIDDGSAVPGADGAVGIRVYYSGSVNPTGKNVAVTGVLIPVTDSSSNISVGILPSTEIQLTD